MQIENISCNKLIVAFVSKLDLRDGHHACRLRDAVYERDVVFLSDCQPRGNLLYALVKYLINGVGLAEGD